MNYYRLLGLTKEPFSTSPDPDFFYESGRHHTALTRLMTEIRLKRGMSLILGEVGTGKTTLSRKFFQMLKTREDIIFHMILDPAEDSELSFLYALLRAFNLPLPPSDPSALACKEAIKKYLFQKGVQEGRTIVFLVDEAQKLNPAALETLRTLLNYETNEYKLLQLVLLGQMELLPVIRGMRNLWDRISFKYMITPLDVHATKEMINFRLRQAGYRSSQPLFSDAAIAEICRYAQGYPRRIGMLCHSALKELIMADRTTVDDEIIRALISEESLVSA